jgi:hypothetical protein
LAEWPPNRTGRWSGTRAGHVTEPGFTGPVPPDRQTRRRTSPAFTGHNECSQKKFPAAAAPALPPSPAASSHSPQAAVCLVGGAPRFEALSVQHYNSKSRGAARGGPNPSRSPSPAQSKFRRASELQGSGVIRDAVLLIWCFSAEAAA